ncbi:MAG: hypothetical protein AB7R55_17040 [Gemmatimonadales bacterium]
MRRGVRAPTVLLAIGLVVARSAEAQTVDACADSVARVLGVLRGEWEVEAHFRDGPNRWDTTRASSSIRPDLRGCLLREDYRGTRYGEPYEFLALWGANGPPDGRIQRFFSHSRHGILGLASGDFRGDTLVLEERLTLRGRPLIQQVLITRPTPDGFRQVNRRSTDEGLHWTETLRAVYRRAKPD